ncbi:MAG: outer membrane lipoprotein carrier protein LolA [Cycloclasticus sp.]|nr:MAG: outer membrane lipoprotein carrier protein LolA [Cycloclasticus sp.]
MRFLRLTLLLLLAIAVSSHANNGGETLQQHLKNYQQISGQFTQTISSEQSSLTQTSNGKFWVKKPGQFRWHYSSPYIQKIVSDGKKLWIYDEDLEQVTIKNSSASMDSTPLSIILGTSDLNQHFSIIETDKKDTLQWLKLMPTSDSSGFEYILIGFENGTLARMQLKDNFGQNTQLLFTHVVIHTSIDTNLFQFEVPEGTDVFEDTIE